MPGSSEASGEPLMRANDVPGLYGRLSSQRCLLAVINVLLAGGVKGVARRKAAASPVRDTQASVAIAAAGTWSLRFRRVIPKRDHSISETALVPASWTRITAAAGQPRSLPAVLLCE